MEQKFKTRREILAVITAILFAATLVTFPYALNLTWAMPGSDSDRTLTYITGSLTWDSGEDIDGNGSIKLGMFNWYYDNVEAENWDNVVAPGTAKNTCIRLLNASPNDVNYYAVLYRDDIDINRVPVTASLYGAGAYNVKQYPLPSDVSEDEVVDVIKGDVGSNSVTTVEIDWDWVFHTDNAGDEYDTMLGNKEHLDSARFGLYIVVEDNTISGVDDNPSKDDETKKDDNKDNNKDNKDDGKDNDKPAESKDNENPIDNNDKDKPTDNDNGNNGGWNGDESNIVAPQTGDNSRMIMWSIFAVTALVVMIFLWVSDKRREKARSGDEN